MPIPAPNAKEEKNTFISRCVSSSVMQKEFPDNKQRVAVCHTSWRKKHKAKKAMRPPFGSVAGKARMAGSLLPLIPDHTTYVEPFAGGAALFWKKGRSEVEVLADADGDIMNAYMVLQTWSDKEHEWLLKQPWGTDRKNFDRAMKMEPQNRAELFWQFRVKQYCSWAGDMKTYGHKSKQGSWAGVKRLVAIKGRLEGVNLHTQDWLETIKQYDSPTTFFFLDPPYPDVMDRQQSFKFFGGFDKISTFEIVRVLKTIEGMFLLTISDTPQMREAFKQWDLQGVQTAALQQGTAHGTKVKGRTELVVTNYQQVEEEEEGVEEVEVEKELSPLTFAITYKAEAERVVGGVVYEANQPDGQGDWASEETIRQAMYYFMESGQQICIDHKGSIPATVLECFQADGDTEKGGGILHKGSWWMALRINDDETWSRVEKDELAGFSWEGLVLREKDISPP